MQQSQWVYDPKRGSSLVGSGSKVMRSPYHPVVTPEPKWMVAAREGWQVGPGDPGLRTLEIDSDSFSLA